MPLCHIASRRSSSFHVGPYGVPVFVSLRLTPPGHAGMITWRLQVIHLPGCMAAHRGVKSRSYRCQHQPLTLGYIYGLEQ